MRKLAIHGCASRFFYVTLDLPCKRAGQVYLQTPRTSYRSSRSHVALRSKRKIDRPLVVQKAHQIYPIRSRARADLPKPPQTVVALVPKVGSVGKHRGAVAANPFCGRNAAVTGRQESLAVVPRKFPLCSINSQPAVQAVGLAVLIRSARPVAQYLVTKMLEVHFSLPGRSRKTRPVRLVHHRDDPISITNRLVSGDLLHFDWLKRNRNVVLSNVVRGRFLEERVKHVLRQSPWQILRPVAMFVGVGTGLAALHRKAPASIHAGNVGG